MVMQKFWDVLGNVFVVFLNFSSNVDVAGKLNGVFLIPLPPQQNSIFKLKIHTLVFLFRIWCCLEWVDVALRGKMFMWCEILRCLAIDFLKCSLHKGFYS